MCMPHLLACPHDNLLSCHCRDACQREPWAWGACLVSVHRVVDLLARLLVDDGRCVPRRPWQHRRRSRVSPLRQKHFERSRNQCEWL